MSHFNDINFELNNIYTRLTGGRAELNFIDSMNPFEGVEFAVRPVNKSWKRVNLLSGGEKTFTSLALIFACEEIKQFPFYFMDEIDAALDYKNTTLLAQYIKEKKNTQHIVISLRKNMYQECNRLVGIYKVNDQSRTLELQMDQLLARDTHIPT
jgi:structural maintenance of chromosome 4